MWLGDQLNGVFFSEIIELICGFSSTPCLITKGYLEYHLQDPFFGEPNVYGKVQFHHLSTCLKKKGSLIHKG